jgi:hypothetical protein
VAVVVVAVVQFMDQEQTVETVEVALVQLGKMLLTQLLEP